MCSVFSLHPMRFVNQMCSFVLPRNQMIYLWLVNKLNCVQIYLIFFWKEKKCSQREKSGFYRINKRNSNVVQTKWIANLLRKHTPIEHFASVSNIHFSQTISIHLMHWWLVWNETNGWIYAYIKRIMTQINHTGATDALPPEITNTEIAGRFRAGNSGQLHSLQINACSM